MSEPIEMKPIDVVYIAGESRSGSTLLDLALGQTPGFFSGGELRYIWHRGFGRNLLCGCGQPFGDCPFWTRIARGLAQGRPPAHPPVDPAAVLAHQMHVDPPESTFKSHYLRPSRFGPAFRRSRPIYVAALAQLYTEIHHQTGCRFLIDSSKAPSHAMLLEAMGAIRLHVIHLVRDARAVAWSMQRKKPRPDVHWKTTYMPTYGPLKTALRWSATNSLLHAWRRGVQRSMLVRYEDFADDPERTLRAVLTFLGESQPSLDFLHGRTLHVAPGHTVAGNPMRFASDHLTIQPDLKWRDRMPRRQRRLIAAATAPLLRRYGYQR